MSVSWNTMLFTVYVEIQMKPLYQKWTAAPNKQ